jgi:hypothetical protein
MSEYRRSANFCMGCYGIPYLNDFYRSRISSLIKISQTIPQYFADDDETRKIHLFLDRQALLEAVKQNDHLFVCSLKGQVTFSCLVKMGFWYFEQRSSKDHLAAIHEWVEIILPRLDQACH